jgi:Bacterial transglutaminase-like N-terminal region
VIRLSTDVVRLLRPPASRTPILTYSLRTKPANHFINLLQDPFANQVAHIVFREPAHLLT